MGSGLGLCRLIPQIPFLGFGLAVVNSLYDCIYKKKKSFIDMTKKQQSILGCVVIAVCVQKATCTSDFAFPLASAVDASVDIIYD